MLLDMDKYLHENSLELEKLSSRFFALESDVSFLMTAFLDGKLEESKGFLGVSLGGRYLTDSWQPSLSIEYELLLSKIALIPWINSLFFDLTWLDWRESNSFQTLPGAAPSQMDIDRESTIFSLGGRLYPFSFSPNVHTYTGALIGHTIDDDQDFFYYAISIGVEHATSDRRVSVELRYDYFPDIERETVEFNPFGSSVVRQTEDSENGTYLGLRVSFR
jgi:hypothetical protein